MDWISIVQDMVYYKSVQHAARRPSAALLISDCDPPGILSQTTTQLVRKYELVGQ